MSWSRLTDVVRHGKPARELPAASEAPDERTKRFIGAMQHYGRQRAPEVAWLIDLAGVTRILDVGGGSGAFCHEFLGRLPGATATLFDLPPVLPLARRYAEDAGLADRMDFVAGNYNTDALPQGYDLVFMSAIVHINSPEQNIRLVAQGAEALRPGGRLVIRDWVMTSDRTQPAAGALFAINMLVNTDVGDTYTADEMREWMEAAGLVDVKILETQDGGGLAVGHSGVVCTPAPV
jgi:SAM-dependent methyltransferase